MTKYSYKKTAIKTLKALIIIGAPVLLQWLPNSILDLTIGGIIYVALDYAKHGLKLSVLKNI
jgi:hypothetical protein